MSASDAVAYLKKDYSTPAWRPESHEKADKAAREVVTVSMELCMHCD